MRKLTFIILLSFVPFWCGCIKYSYEAYQVKIIDAEENIPIEGADVSIGYMSKRPSPPSSRAVTDQRGLAELQVADGFNWFVHVSAEGYIPFDYMSFRDYLSRQDLIKQNDNERTVLIYKKPEPKIEIVVPDGYCGPVNLKIKHIDKLIQSRPNQRVFSYKMIPNGTVTAQVSPLFYGKDLNSIISVRYENGNVVPPSEFLYRLVSNDRLRWKTFVGSGNDLADWLQKRNNQNDGIKKGSDLMMFDSAADYYNINDS